MYLKHKINAVNGIFRQVDTHIFRFREKLEINCASMCGLCCMKSDIEATILEFLPAAYNLYLTGKYIEVLNNIESRSDSICIFYNPFSNGNYCSYYQNRGLVCRLYGFSKRIDKQENNILVTCKPIKESLNSKKIYSRLIYAPDMSAYYLKLFGIDPKLTVQYFPINQSIKKALEIVLLFYQYSKKPA